MVQRTSLLTPLERSQTSSESTILGSATTAYELDWLEARGSWIVSDRGDVVMLRGVNLFGLQYAPPSQGFASEHNEADFERMASWGFNVVRLCIAWDLLEPNSGRYDWHYMDLIKQRVIWAKQHGVYTILDMHKNSNWSEKFGGYGVPSWAVKPYNTREEAIRGFYLNENGIQDRFAAVWNFLAAEFAEDPAVAGYDLFNEPASYYAAKLSIEEWRQRLQSLYEKTIDSIRKVDGRHMILVEPDGSFPRKPIDLDRLVRVVRPNVVYSPHPYIGEEERDGDWNVYSYDGNKAALDEWFKPLYDLVCLRWKAPLWMGEFSSAIGDKRSIGAVEYAEDMLDLMDHYKLGWAWHAYMIDRKGTSTSYLLDAKGFVREQLVRILDRVYPQSASLLIEDFAYDPHSHIADLTIGKQEKTLNATIRLHVPSWFFDVSFVNSGLIEPRHDWNKVLRILTVWLSLREAVSIRLEFSET